MSHRFIYMYDGFYIDVDHVSAIYPNDEFEGTYSVYLMGQHALYVSEREMKEIVEAKYAREEEQV